MKEKMEGPDKLENRRTELLLGSAAMDRIARTRVILFGVGGVGSWCAESLVRSGIRHLTLVDSDCVAASNCNRQLMATPRTVGQVKVEAMRERLLEINPEAEIKALQMTYCEETAAQFELETYDYVIDAIDSLADKAHLILQATSLSPRVTLISSMGAALRFDPTKVRCAEFWKVQGDALARALRNRFKKQKDFPKSKFVCVYSEEAPTQNQEPTSSLKSGDMKLPSPLEEPRAKGSISFVTGAFGLTIASLVIRGIMVKD